MWRFLFLLSSGLALLASYSSSLASAALVEHTFHVQNLTVERLCKKQVITAVNGSFPGPTISVREGDTLLVHVLNESPYNLTIHWHGVFQKLSGWADGPNMITQCPIVKGKRYTYKFKVTKQEGTLWWHAHLSWLRATVYGALIILPPSHRRPYFPYPQPHKHVPILLGEWWNANVIDVENEATASGGAPNISDAYTINGLPGDLYPCSLNQIYKLKVTKGKTYMLRIINAALNNQLFFKIANHKMTVVAVDASYTTPYLTDVVVIAPGQTTDVLLTADQSVSSSYYIAASPYASAPGIPFDNTTTRGILIYSGGAATNPPKMPIMPEFDDTPTAHRFFSNLTGLPGGPHWVPVPRHVDERMFVTIGLGLEACGGNPSCAGPNGQRSAASMNNFSFVFPTKLSILQAFFFGVAGVYTSDFPDTPPLEFDYTDPSVNNNTGMLFPRKATRVKMVRYNATVEVVLQNTAILAVENHPMHLHGFDFHVLGQGFGNFEATKDRKKLNFVNPQMRNTIAVPVGGWAVIRFTANNPGAWMMHCHLDVHLGWGLATVLLVENGPSPSSTLPPPPLDLPRC